MRWVKEYLCEVAGFYVEVFEVPTGMTEWRQEAFLEEVNAMLSSIASITGLQPRRIWY